MELEPLSLNSYEEIARLGQLEHLSLNSCEDAARLGQLEVLKWLLLEKKIPYDPSIYDIAVEYNKIRVVEWLERKRYPKNYVSCYEAGRTGNVEMIKWFTNNLALENLGIQFYLATGYSGIVDGKHIEMIKWYVKEAAKSQYYIINIFITLQAALNGQIEILEILKNNDCLLKNSVYDGIAQSGNQDVLEWAISNVGICTNVNSCHVALERGNYGILKKMTQTIEIPNLLIRLFNCKKIDHCPKIRKWTQKYTEFGIFLEVVLNEIEENIRYGHFDVMKLYWKSKYKNFRMFKNNTFMNCFFICVIKYQEISQMNEIYKWFLLKSINKKNCHILNSLLLFPQLDNQKINHFVIKNAKKINDIKTLKMLHECNFQFDTSLFYNYAIEMDNLEIIEWLLCTFENLRNGKEYEYYVVINNIIGLMECQEKGFVFNEKACELAFKLNKQEALRWIILNVMIPKYTS
jgi:hypothetical protein